MVKKIWDCPCDSCPKRAGCGSAATECRAVRIYYEKGHFDPQHIGQHLRKMKVRSKK